MDRLSFATLVLVLVYSTACQSPQSNSDTGSTVDSADAAMARPDAKNPVNGNGNVPEGWIVRADEGTPTIAPDTTGDIRLVNMTPGWHVTSGPAAIYYHPANSATGSYSLTADIFLFDPGTRKEAFGLFIGGSNLESADQQYSYFLIRQGGQFLVKNRHGAETSTAIEWTDNEAIQSFPGSDGSTALNKLELRVTPESVEFLVNGTSLTTVPADQVETDGIVGLRINHGLNLHISDLTLTEM